MKIGLVSTMRTSVPPVKTGSVELVVGLLAREMVRLGHEVTVFAPGDSTVHARVLSVLPRGYHDDPSIWDWQLAEFMQMGLVYEHAAEFDVINSHVYCYGLPFSRLVRTPTVHTFHICPTPDFVRYCRMYPEGDYVLISEFQRQLFDDVPVSDVIYNGIDTSAFPFNPDPGRYLAFLGDIRADKGPLEAIRCAREAGVPLKIAGPATTYYKEVVRPYVDGVNIEYVGELDHAGKVELLSGALALVFPVRALEACPLVILEAMACGTPILGLGYGPVPELVEPQVTGIYVSDVEEMSRQVERLAGCDRSVIRRVAVERFDVARMARDYLRLFERVADRERSRVAR